ncbi:MAG: mRNA surveillance protein pelota [archaeon]|nr:mRNA surveillance protein pelota [archaeon]
MNIIHSDFKKGVAKLLVTDLDDLWYLSQIIDPGDLVKGKTTRKIKIGDGDNATVTKKTITLTVEAETIEFGSTGNSLRINGRIRDGPEDIPRDSYHAITLEEGSEFTLEKKQWLSYQKQKLEEASKKKNVFLLCLFDREEALFALTKKDGAEVISTLTGEMPKKGRDNTVSKDFYQEIINTLETYNDRFTPQKIILASPAFYKEDLLGRIKNANLSKNIALATCSSVSKSAIDEVFRRPELAAVLQNVKVREHHLLVEELLKEINANNLATYGLESVRQAAEAGAIKEILITDAFIQKKREEEQYESVDALLKLVDSTDGKIHLLSSQEDSGKTIDGLGGIAGILRYKLEW